MTESIQAQRRDAVVKTIPDGAKHGVVRVAFLAMLAVYCLSYFQRTAVPGTIFNELQQEFKTSASAIVGLGSMYLWVYGSMQLVAGIIADRFGGGRVLLAGGAVSAAGGVLFALSHSPGMLYVSRALTAFGDSFIFLSILKEVTVLFEHRRFARLTGVVLFAGLVGGMLAMLPFERAAHFFGWHGVLLTTGGLLCVAVSANFLVLPKLEHFAPQRTPFSLRPLWEILKNRYNWPLFIASIIKFPIYFVLQVGIGKKFIQDFAGVSSQRAATFTLVMMMVTAGLYLSSGLLLRLTGERRRPCLVLASSLLVAATGLLLAGVLCKAGAWVFLISYILMALSNVSNPIGTAVMKELNDSRYLAQALALGNAIPYIGVAIVLMMSGMVLDLFRDGAQKTATGLIYPVQAYAALFAIFVGLAVIGLIATCYIRETRDVPAGGLAKE